MGYKQVKLGKNWIWKPLCKYANICASPVENQNPRNTAIYFQFNMVLSCTWNESYACWIFFNVKHL